MLGYMGIMEIKMETTIQGLGFARRRVLGLAFTLNPNLGFKVWSLRCRSRD